MCGISERLTSERKRLGLTQAKLADTCGVAERTQANYESGSRSPDGNYWSALDKAGADILYIITGSRKEAGNVDLDQEQRELLTLWRRVPMRSRHALMVLMQQLIPHTDMSDASIEFIDPDSIHSEKEKV